MIKSMTGFGRCENHQGDRKFTVEMKSVNHRYFDSNIKMPKKLSIFESAIRNLLKEYIQRGKVDIFITYEDFTENNVSLKYNENIAAEYVHYYQQLSEKFQLRNDICASVIGRSPEVFTMEEVRNEVQNEEPETGKENESKSERFIRLAEGRVTKARMAISRLSYLSNTGNYEYTPQQVEQMFSVLEQELAEVKSGFMKTAKEEKKFSFQ